MMDNDGSSGDGGSPSAPHLPFCGQLSKFTNVVKGWQYRWFVLDPDRGTIEYYLLRSHDENKGGGGAGGDSLSGGVGDSNSNSNVGKFRQSRPLGGTRVLPSEEDSQTFNLNFVQGESYKLRAADAKERQVRQT